MTGRVGVGVVGLGWWGRMLADSIGRTSNGIVVSCFARTDETRDAFAADYGCASARSLDELLADAGFSDTASACHVS